MSTDTFENNQIQFEYDEQQLTQMIYNLVIDMDAVSRFTYSSITENVTKNVLKIDQTVQGIKLSLDDDKYSINIHICVFYGYNIPQLSYDIQSKVKNMLEDITDTEVKSVNIYVEGIDRIN